MAQNKGLKFGALGGTTPCCPCAPACGNVKICVAACGGQPVVGATVAVTALGLSCTTDSTGCCLFMISSNQGNQTLTVTAPNARYQNYSGTQLIDCGSNISIPLSPASGYTCSPCFVEPIPTTLNYTLDGLSGMISSTSATTLCLSKTDTYITYPVIPCSNHATDPCTIADASCGASIVFDLTTNCEVVQSVDCGTDCSNSNPACPGQTAPDYASTCVGSTFTHQNFNGSGFCACIYEDGLTQFFGQDSTCTGSISIGTGNPVPVNISFNFVALGAGCECFPLFNSGTITE